ncbi:nitrilase-related carbon-nitrogen hydrolase, partial [Streptomyces sp. NPDC058667]|uniref:nitrilase-related carbon-nitrogen hydrolase n=1 Tax=Streptomyces sp. NPDC058667 TaxID=3346588 RepID=UPI0036572A12
MPQLRLALNQIDSTVGDIAGNAEAIVHWTRHAAGQGAHLVAFPEMALTGYPVEDLALRSSFVEASRAALRGLARRLADEGFGELPVVVGYLDRSERAEPRLGRPAGSPENAAAVLHGGGGVGGSGPPPHPPPQGGEGGHAECGGRHPHPQPRDPGDRF